MKIYNTNQIKKIEEYTIKNYIPSILLMENAAFAVVKTIYNIFEKDIESKKILVVCGPGNNGGDGFTIARHFFLKKYNKNIEIYFLGDESKLPQDSKINYDICKKIGIKFINKLNIKENYDIIIDAVFGIGLNRDIKGEIFEVIDNLNNMKAFKVAVDIPSGIDSDNGTICGIALKADITVSFNFYKLGHILYPAREYCGKVIIENIGVVDCEIEKTVKREVILKDYIKLNKREKDTHKGNYGKILVIGGSTGMSGAVYMAGEAALKCGAGLITLAVPQSINNIIETKTTEVMSMPLEDINGTIDKSNLKKVLTFIREFGIDVIVIGCGLRREIHTIEFVKELIKNIELPVIVDADALYALKDNLEIIKGKKAVLTPHTGEFLRLIKKDKIDNKLEEAEKFARENEIILVLKGADTIVTDGKKTYINYYGNPGMATGGMGDILCGILASFAIEEELIEASKKAVFFHSYTADRLNENISEKSITPTEVVGKIGLIMKEFE